MRLGGDLTWAEWLASKGRTALAVRPLVFLGASPCLQCRCGERKIVKYRGRYYCRPCGKRFNGVCVRRNAGQSCDCDLPFPPRTKATEANHG